MGGCGRRQRECRNSCNEFTWLRPLRPPVVFHLFLPACFCFPFSQPSFYRSSLPLSINLSPKTLPFPPFSPASVTLLPPSTITLPPLLNPFIPPSVRSNVSLNELLGQQSGSHRRSDDIIQSILWAGVREGDGSLCFLVLSRRPGMLLLFGAAVENTLTDEQLTQHNRQTGPLRYFYDFF